MKSIAITTFFIVIWIGLTAQTVITYSNNGLIPGDSYNFKEIQFPDPGSAGPNQIWDFSKVQFTGKPLLETCNPPLFLKWMVLATIIYRCLRTVMITF